MPSGIRKIVSLLLIANIAGLWVADLHLVNEDTCQIHKNCCCPADRCTCQHEETFPIDACAVSEWECESVPVAGLSFLLGFALPNACPTDPSHAVNMVNWFPPIPVSNSPIPFDVFRPPQT